MRRRSACGAALITAALAVVTPTPTAGLAAELAVSGRSNANASIAASGQVVGIVWGAATEKGATDVYLATSRDGGRTFGSPARVNDAASWSRGRRRRQPARDYSPRASGAIASCPKCVYKYRTGRDLKEPIRDRIATDSLSRLRA